MSKNEKNLNFIDNFLSEHKKSNIYIIQYLMISKESN